MSKEEYIEKILNMSDDEFNRFLAFVELQIIQEAEHNGWMFHRPYQLCDLYKPVSMKK